MASYLIKPGGNTLEKLATSCRRLFDELFHHIDDSNFDPSATKIHGVGDIVMTGRATARAGWLLCDGAAVSRTTYADLFAAIGTTYGAGDASTTFNLPNLKGAFPKGAGTQTVGGVVYGSAGDNRGPNTGLANADKMQGHKHVGVDASPSAQWYTGVNGSLIYNIGTGASPVGVPTTDGTNGTPRTGTVTEPANVVVNFMIKF